MLVLVQLASYCVCVCVCAVFKGQAHKNYWFWFDEQSCRLKYYKSRETYIAKVYEPFG